MIEGSGGPAEFPEVIGGYRLGRPLGRGGMGAVFEATGPDGTRVALKVSRVDREDDRTQRRFRRESSAIVDHPNVVRVLGSGVSGDWQYIVQELVEGETLREILDRGPMSPEDAIELGIQLCRGLGAAHAAGIVHRDLKPANVIRTRDGIYRLVDFGMALRHSDETRMTMQGEILGTPAYLAPEQARGEIDVDHRVDIWALGILLYEALVGSTPFDRGAPLATMLAVVMDRIVPLHQVAPETPAALQVAVTRALSKDRDDRWGDAQRFAGALLGVGTGWMGSTEADPSPAVNPDERRLVSVLLAEDLLDPFALMHTVHDRGGVFIQLQRQRGVGIFGGWESRGDELKRAAEVALECLSTARRMAVAAGRAQGEHSIVDGEALAAAERACAAPIVGVAVDERTAPALARWFELRRSSAGISTIVARRDAAGPERSLLGRDVELATIARDLDRVADEGTLAVVAVSGARGAGKSAVLQAAGQAAIGEGRLIVRLGLEPLDSNMAFAAAGRLARGLLRAYADADLAGAEPQPLELTLEGLVDTPVRSAEFLSELMGARTPRSSELLEAARSDAQLMRDQVRGALGDLLAGLCRKHAIFIFCDDLHWSDDATLELLSELLDDSDERPVALVATVLPEKSAAIDALFARPLAREVALAPLSRGESVRIAEAIAGRPLSDELGKVLHERTGGNPLFIEQIVLHLESAENASASQMPLPLTIEAAVQSRLDGLAQAEKELCKRASIIERAFAPDELVALGIEEPRGAIQSLLRMSILSVRRASSQTRYSFRSSTVRLVARQMLPDESARRLHRRLAGYLAARAPGAPEEVARHYSLADDAADAAAWYARATLAASSRGDALAVLRCSNAALEAGLAPDFDLLMARCDALRFLGRREEQAAELDRALGLATEVSQRAIALTEKAWLLSRTEAGPRALEVAEAAVAAARESQDDETLALSLGWRAVTLAHGGRSDEAERCVAEAAGRVQRLGPRAHALVAEWQAQIAGARGDLAERLRAFSTAEKRFREVGDVRRAAGAACNVADLYNRLGDYEQAERELRAARAGCRRVGNRLVEGYVSANLGYSLTRLGRLAEALDELEHASLLARASNDRLLELVADLYRLRAQLAGPGTPPEIEAVVEVAGRARSLGIPALTAQALVLASRAALAAGERARALSFSTGAAEILEQVGGVEEGEADIFVAHMVALRETGDAAAAEAVRLRGKERVQEIAATIDDTRLRGGFLAIEEHRLLTGDEGEPQS